MGALLGLTFGLGLLLIWQSALGPRRSRGSRRGPRVLHRIADTIAEAGIEAVTPRQVVASCAGAGLFVALGSLVVSQTWPIALAFGVEKLKDSPYSGLTASWPPSDGTDVEWTAPGAFSLLAPAYAARYGVELLGPPPAPT